MAAIPPKEDADMKINSPADGRIIVDLTNEDMRELDITYEDMDYSTIETRRVIWTVLDAAGKSLGREIDPSNRMIIEASPKSGGGCVLSFTILEGQRIKPYLRSTLKKQEKALLCEFSSLDDMFRAAESCRAPSAESSLYENGGKYRMIITPQAEMAPIKRHFAEFCTDISFQNSDCEFTREHWHLLIDGNALDTLNRQAP